MKLYKGVVYNLRMCTNEDNSGPKNIKADNYLCGSRTGNLRDLTHGSSLNLELFDNGDVCKMLHFKFGFKAMFMFVFVVEKDYQLVSWSRDQVLKIWKVDSILQRVRF